MGSTQTVRKRGLRGACRGPVAVADPLPHPSAFTEALRARQAQVVALVGVAIAVVVAVFAGAEGAEPVDARRGDVGRLVADAVARAAVVDVGGDIDAAASLNLSGVARCLEPLVATFPPTCATATLTWSREAPLYVDGRHRSVDDVRMTTEGVSDPKVTGCLEALRDTWGWAPDTNPMPPEFGFSLHLALANSTETIKNCAASQFRGGAP